MLILTERAQVVVNRLINSSGELIVGFRISVIGVGCSGMKYAVSLESTHDTSDSIIECGEINLIVDAKSLQLLKNVTVDYIDSQETVGFKFTDSNPISNCSGCSSSN